MIERTVRIKAETETVWQNLLSTLTAHGYTVKVQNPYTQISAERGSKVSSFFLEGTKGGYRNLNITIFPQGQEQKEFDVQFKFDFPSWALTLSGTRKECLALIEEFVRLTTGQGVSLTESEAEKAASTVPSGGLICEKCKTDNPIDASFCGSCGAKLKCGDSQEQEGASKAVTCPNCKASSPSGSKFCSNCGTSL